MRKLLSLLSFVLCCFITFGCIKTEILSDYFAVGVYRDVIEIEINDVTTVQYQIVFDFNKDFVIYQCCKKEITIVKEESVEFENIILYPTTKDIKDLLITEAKFSKRVFSEKLKEWNELRNGSENYFYIDGNRNALCTFLILDKLIEHCKK